MLLQQLVERALQCSPRAAEIVHRAGEQPRLRAAGRESLHLSSASRGGLAALALARVQVGIDVEEVSDGVGVPWNVLHPAEAAALRALPPDARDRAFARLWTCKEAYLKALGSGLSREPASFAVEVVGESSARIVDPAAATRRTNVASAWLDLNGRCYSATAVMVW